MCVLSFLFPFHTHVFLPHLLSDTRISTSTCSQVFLRSLTDFWWILEVTGIAKGERVRYRCTNRTIYGDEKT